MKIMTRLVPLLTLLGGVALADGVTAETATVTETEIAHLVGYLRQSDCEFYRNGSWYSPDKAIKHIDRKYRYLMKRGLVDSSEQFIDRAASRSSMSGKAYLVKCGDGAAIESATWFTDELRRFRKEPQE